MAKINEFVDLAAMNEWTEWVATRPPIIQELIALLPPDRLYRMKTTGSRVTLVSYAEDRTVTVFVSGEFNAVMFDRQVFGVSPDNLEECELPAKDDFLGTLLTEPEQVDAFIDAVRSDVLANREVTK